MSYPAILFAFIWATILGAAFHLWRGGSAGKRVLFLVLSWFGFAAGQWAATNFHWGFDLYGQIHVLFGSVGSVLMLIIGNFLSFKDA